jgi:hypothetical protein
VLALAARKLTKRARRLTGTIRPPNWYSEKLRQVGESVAGTLGNDKSLVALVSAALEGTYVRFSK